MAGKHALGQCPEVVWNKESWRSMSCGRPVKNAELGLCGIHARAKLAREAAAEEHARAQREYDANKADMVAVLKALHLDKVVYIQSIKNRTVMLSLDTLKKLVGED